MRDVVVGTREIDIREDDFVFWSRVKLGDQVQVLVNGKEVARCMISRNQIMGALTDGCDFFEKLKEINEISLNGGPRSARTER